MAPYDAWRLAGPDTPDPVGTEPDQPCGRYADPDEDAPRGHKPKCQGEMLAVCDACGTIDPKAPCGAVIAVCDTCGEIA